MTAIEASSARCKTMADGTLQLTVNIEPRDAIAAFTLFGSPGVAMALAAIKPPEPEKPKRDRMAPLCEWAVYRCKEPSFQLWAAGQQPLEADVSRLYAKSEAWARSVVLKASGAKSRSELDTNPAAAAAFKTRVMEPYAAWLKSQGTA